MNDLAAVDLADVLDVGVVVLDGSMRVAVWNRWMERHSGIRPGEILGADLFERFPEIRRRGKARWLVAAAEHGRHAVLSPLLHGYLIELPHEEGDRRIPMYQRVSITPEVGDREPRGLVLIIEDFTARILRDRELGQLNRILTGQRDLARLLATAADEEGFRDAVLELVVEGMEYAAARIELPGRAVVERGAPDGREPLECPLELSASVEGCLSVWPRPAAGCFSPMERELLAETGRDTAFGLRALGERAARRRAEIALYEERERLSLTLASIGDGVISTDLDGRVVLLNQMAERITEWTTELAAGQPLTTVFRIINEHTLEPCENPVEKVLATGQIVGLANSTVLITRSGAERLIADSAAPVRDESGATLGVVLVFRDVTEIRRLEDQAQRSERLESLGRLAGGIAHDFNNILTVITGYLHVARGLAREGSELWELLGETDFGIEQARGLTGQLLTFAKGGAPVRSTVSIAEMIRETVRFALRGARSRPELRIAADLLPVSVDLGQVSQVIQNLVNNADQAMPDGGTIEIAASNLAVGDAPVPALGAGRYIRITVTDHGVGIPEHIRERIFDPYFSTKGYGRGIGLATSQSIIANHGGAIEVRSLPGQGATFEVYLPATDEPLPEPEARAAPRSARVSGRVLVMDDDPAIRRVLKRMEPALGFRVDLVADGRTAVERYARAQEAGAPYAGVVLDLTVPGGMGGAEAMARLREIDPGVRALVVSGYSDDDLLSSYEAHGFRGALRKPFTPESLREAVHEILADTESRGAGGPPAPA